MTGKEIKSVGRILIYNANLITPNRMLNNGSLLIEDGRIACVSSGRIDAGDCYEIDAGGNYVSPGFIDIHTHGGGGHDFMDGTVGAYIGAAESHMKHGTTAIVPTTLTSTYEELRNTFAVFKEAKASNKKGAQMLGLHLEGPYFAISQRGAQDPKYIKNPDPKEYEEILGWSDDILRWSAAPELEGAMEFGRCLKNRGILVSIAHSDAIYEDVLDAFKMDILISPICIRLCLG